MSIYIRGLKFYIKDNNRLYINGLGFVLYKSSIKLIAGESELELCIKTIKDESPYVAITDTRNTSLDCKVLIGTYESIGYLTIGICIVGFGIRVIYKKLNK